MSNYPVPIPKREHPYRCPYRPLDLGWLKHHCEGRGITTPTLLRSEGEALQTIFFFDRPLPPEFARQWSIEQVADRLRVLTSSTGAYVYLGADLVAAFPARAIVSGNKITPMDAHIPEQLAACEMRARAFVAAQDKGLWTL